MRESKSTVGMVLGVAVGVVVTVFYLGSPRPMNAASNDRSGEYVMATGAVSINPRVQTDGVWFLDYRAGKLLGTVIDKTAGKIVGWAEVDLTSEFGVKATQDVHFMMTTGYVTQGQSALYVAETSTGKFGVYTMGPGANGQGIVIRRHDMTSFRNTESVAAPGGAPLANTNILGQPAAPLPVLAPGGVSPTLPLTPGPGGMPAPAVTIPTPGAGLPPAVVPGMPSTVVPPKK